MRIWIADEGETLRTIAYKNEVQPENLIPLNPHIANPDLNISGIPVYLHSSLVTITNPSNVLAPCLPPVPQSTYIEHWLPLTPLEIMAETEYDVLIVGTGAGGGAVIWRLCEQWQKSNKRIGVIEAGDLLLPTNAANIPSMNSERVQNYFRHVSNPLMGSLSEFPGAVQFFALGGRTLFWNGISPRMNLQLENWPISIQEMEAYYPIAEQVMNVTNYYTDGSSFTDILLNRLRQNGVPTARTIPISANLQSTADRQGPSDVFFSSTIFLAEALNRRPFDLAVRARAVQVLVENEHVTGVKAVSPDRKAYVIKAKTVVLSASTFETPRLLLHSGIRGRAIGHYLTNHSFVSAVGSVKRKEFPDDLGALGILIPSSQERPYQVQLRGPDGYFWNQPYQEKPLSEKLEINFLCFGSVESRFENKITLDPYKRDEYGVPAIQVHFSYSDKDRSVIRQIAAAVNQISTASGIKLGSKYGRPSVCLMPPGELQHDSGTCRIGDNPETSAVDLYGRIHGYRGLYIADNSVLPLIGGENPTLTTVTLAIRTADHIIREVEHP